MAEEELFYWGEAVGKAVVEKLPEESVPLLMKILYKLMSLLVYRLFWIVWLFPLSQCIHRWPSHQPRRDPFLPGHRFES